MACFASSRRSGWVRVLVLILCALFIFATIGAPPAHALGVEAVAVFGLASVLSAATAALGFKLASNEQGQATLQKMVQDFKTVAWATGFVLVGSKLNGLQNGMDYIKMQVKEGKTYLDSRVFAWVQQWLAQNGVYSDSGVVYPSQADQSLYSYRSVSFDYMLSIVNAAGADVSIFKSIIDHYSISQDSNTIYGFYVEYYRNKFNEPLNYHVLRYDNLGAGRDYYFFSFPSDVEGQPLISVASIDSASADKNIGVTDWVYHTYSNSYEQKKWTPNYIYLSFSYTNKNYTNSSGITSMTGASVSVNDTGLSGTDTLGKDVVDLTLDQILQKLKEWAQDWFDAGADSATNAATGAQDLPLTVATGAATANPSIAEDGPLVWFPSFGLPIPKLRSGETDTKTVDQGKENASAAETSTVDVAENQSVINSLVNWALSYISPDTGLFSKFPLCVPYDAYLLVTSSLGVDAVGSDSIFGASPGDLEGVVSQDIDTYSDFQPIINIKHDFELDGKTYPVELTIDLTPWQPFVTFFREGMALLLIAELIGSEFKRIRGH